MLEFADIYSKYLNERTNSRVGVIEGVKGQMSVLNHRKRYLQNIGFYPMKDKLIKIYNTLEHPRYSQNLKYFKNQK